MLYHQPHILEKVGGVQLLLPPEFFLGKSEEKVQRR